VCVCVQCLSVVVYKRVFWEFVRVCVRAFVQGIYGYTDSHVSSYYCICCIHVSSYYCVCMHTCVLILLFMQYICVLVLVSIVCIYQTCVLILLCMQHICVLVLVSILCIYQSIELEDMHMHFAFYLFSEKAKNMRDGLKPFRPPNCSIGTNTFDVCECVRACRVYGCVFGR
jgi:hypothetical protein